MISYKKQKKFMRIITFLLILLGLTFQSCTKQERFVRKNIHSPEASADIEALSKALGIMRSKDCNDPTSWYYQGAIHWIPDTIENNQLCASYHTKLELKEGWDNCTHTHTSVDEVNFLVWHRLYIWHFEKIVRKLSGKSDFALPYWPYDNINDSVSLTLPAKFRDSTSALWEPARIDSLNIGFPIKGEMVRALDITNLMDYTDYALFAKNIDAAPHGAIHDYVGHGNESNYGKYHFNNKITGTETLDGLMGWVPTAAFDPVFWIHHSNIDRIWQKWTNSPNGKNVTLDQLKNNPFNYVFFDENGEKVIYSPEQIMEIIYNMDYDFDDCKVSPNETVEWYPSEKIEDTLYQVGVKIPVMDQVTDSIGMIGRGFVYGKKTKVMVEIEVSFTEMPGGSYEVYLNHTPNEPFETNEDDFIGFMTFFGKDHKVNGKACKGGCCLPVKDGRTHMSFKYEINVQKTWDFTVYKHSGFHSGDILIEKITFLE